ncbi:lipoate--protein ligase family protein [Horticoccus luteus]|uniref:Lipoate--protein ligase family protein n=1 Tax=Horticoccus luteus TaxID=2862869 RepID=A0A8F9TWM9_9BACT|nr:lipoate--protein ligase family protein [Horticoccus luteus]QYM78917.1 lipoate--protein ligase family protein [Horticoccus luteus]
MNLHVLPIRTAGAAENMAADFLLLQRYPGAPAVRFRHYEWRAPAFTFGFSQKIAFIRATLPPDETFDLCRRPTGGGLVDHRDDWTYTLVVPRGHPLEELRASASYRATHECLAAALVRQGVPALIKTTCEPAAEGNACGAAGVCFQRAELYDVVHRESGEKIAGAAQKRNKHGLLFQGSLWRPAVGAPLDWDQLHDDFVAALAESLAVQAAPTPWPDFADDELSGLTDAYSSPEWIEAR